jgi:hypothetical protein
MRQSALHLAGGGRWVKYGEVRSFLIQVALYNDSLHAERD